MTALSLQKWIGLVLLSAGVGLWVFGAMTNTRGLPYRLWSRYVTHIEQQLESMFIWQNANYVASVQAAVALTLTAGWVFMGESSMLYGAVMALVLPNYVIGSMVTSRRVKIDNQVDAFTMALGNALRTTASIGDALQSTLAVTPKPVVQELELALKQVRLGSSIPDALLAMSARVQSKPLDTVVSALLIGRQSGGDLPSILERTASSLRELKRLEEMTSKMLRNAKQATAISCLTATVVLIGMPYKVPSLFTVYRDTFKGQMVAAQLAFAYCLALYFAYKFTRVDV